MTPSLYIYVYIHTWLCMYASICCTFTTPCFTCEVPSGDATNVQVREGLAETAEESGALKRSHVVLIV